MGASSSTNATETVGAIGVGLGHSRIGVASASGRVTAVSAARLDRSGAGTLIVSGTTLGESSQTSNTTRVFLATGPSGANFVGTGGSAASGSIKNLGIIPWVIADGRAATFATYHSTQGVRPLASAERQTTIAAAVVPGVGGTGDNVRSATAETGITSKTVNSLFLDRKSVV